MNLDCGMGSRDALPRMFDSLADGLTAYKAGALEATAKALINQKIEKFGAVTRLQIDSKRKTVLAELALKGEAAPIQFDVDAYEVTEQDGECYLTIRKIRASREWLDALLQEVVIGRPWKIPGIAKMVL
jgi:hypothetical protein